MNFRFVFAEQAEIKLLEILDSLTSSSTTPEADRSRSGQCFTAPATSRSFSSKSDERTD